MMPLTTTERIAHQKPVSVCVSLVVRSVRNRRRTLEVRVARAIPGECTKGNEVGDAHARLDDPGERGEARRKSPELMCAFPLLH